MKQNSLNKKFKALASSLAGSARRKEKVSTSSSVPAHWKALEANHTEQEPSRLSMYRGHEEDDERINVWKAKDSEAFWKEHLATTEFRALRQKEGLTASLSNQYSNFFPKCGHFACRACGLPLFSAESKIEAQDKEGDCPNFGCSVEHHLHAAQFPNTKGVSSRSTKTRGAPTLTECARCRSHIGQVVVDRTPTRHNPHAYFRERHQVQGMSLAYVKKPLDKQVYDRAVVLRHKSTIVHKGEPIFLYQ